MKKEIPMCGQTSFVLSIFHRIVSVGLLLITIHSAYGQKTLLHQIKNAKQDSTRLRLYVQVADLLHEQENFDSLLVITQRAIPLAAALQSEKYEGHLYYYLGQVYRHRRSLSKTLETLQKSLSFSRRVNNVELQYKTMYYISTVYIDQGNYKAAIAQCLTNLDFSKKHQLPKLETHTYDLLHNLYRDLGNKAQSKFYLNKLAQLIDRVKNPPEKISVYSNLAQFYEDEGKYKEAWPYRQKAVEASLMDSKKSRQLPNLIQASRNLRKQHRLKEAMAYLEKADLVNRELPVKKVGGHIYNEMALVHIELGNYKQALWLVQHFVDYAKSLNLAKDISIGLETLALVQEKMGHHRQSLQSYKEYHTIMDSLLTVEKSTQIAKIQTLYEVEKKENTILSLQKKAQLNQLKAQQQEQKLKLAERQRLLYVISIGSLTVLIGIIGYFLNKLYKAQQLLTRKKEEIETQAQQLQESNQLKDRLFTIVGHDLRSPVASLKASFTLLQMQGRYPNELTDLEQEVNGLSRILDNVLYWSLNQQNGLKPHQQRLLLSDLVEDVLEGFAGFIDRQQLIVTFDAEPIYVWTDENMTMLVLRNILHNAFKFTPSGGAVRLSIRTDLEQTYLRIADTGPGMNLNDINPQVQKQGTGVGLNLSRDLMQYNGGQLTLESQLGQGTAVTLSWPNTNIV